MFGFTSLRPAVDEGVYRETPAPSPQVVKITPAIVRRHQLWLDSFQSIHKPLTFEIGPIFSCPQTTHRGEQWQRHPHSSESLWDTALCGYPIVKMEIRGSKVLKSKGLVFAQFCSKYDNSSSDWWKTVQILEEKYSRHIFVQNEAVIGKKPVEGVG